MSKYTIQDGDTFEIIARRVYGDDQKAYLLRNRNPGATDPLSAGESLIIAPDPDATGTAEGRAAASAPNEVALSVDGKRFRGWDTISVTRSIDTVSVAEFTAPFDPFDADTREAFRPFAFKRVEVDVGGRRMFTGTMVNPTPSTSANERKMNVSCYGLPGVLGDCTAPASAYPIGWDNATLKTIVTDAAALLGIGTQFDGDAGPVFPRAALRPGDKILDFLATLAAQRNRVLGDTPDGRILVPAVHESGQPVASMAEGETGPILSVSPQFSPQDYHSHVTGIAPVILGLAGTQYTVKNARLADVLRPYTFNSGDVIDSTIVASANSKAGRMFTAAVAYAVELATWRDPSGNLWAPNTLVEVYAPGAMIYTRSTFLVRSVTLSKTANTELATLDLTLPGTMAGKIPERMPWDE